ncbi:Hypothetical protein HVIM_04539 (plasmid) [Roseomonas mucosa]|jgi:hypothetical protein|uniref:Uncharacterized protein n=1 Tax=Roseomonas mucosa TaxID=207340 RepID=A0A379PPB2_9PROT|nr:Hypothetical protein HVIM_04539 [Roseomonas mucosa]QDD97239.1 Hypothetical protein ADP8_04539a [Roseomonas mucosa]SUE95671.1 Uncharacterised protein [Roseomonas mucosa]
MRTARAVSSDARDAVRKRRREGVGGGAGKAPRIGGGLDVTRMLMLAVLLVPGAGMAQTLLPPGYAPGAVVTTPGNGGGLFGNGPVAGPFGAAQSQTGAWGGGSVFGSERATTRRTAAGCVFAGQSYSEGAVVGEQGRARQVCAARRGGTVDEDGNVPLAWQLLPGE